MSKVARTPIHDRVDRLRKNEDPYMVAKLGSGWLCLSDEPFLEGHCVFFADPVVFSINDQTEEQRLLYSKDVFRVGDVLLAELGAYRINYETMCNVAQSLHSHIVPRFGNEPEHKRRERPAVAYANPAKAAPNVELIKRLKRCF